MAIIKAYKKLGETPLERLEKLRIEYEIPEREPITFAGRLDPAAEGEMIILSGSDIKNKEKYLHADKVYEVEYLFGMSTDTGDLLGLIKKTDFSYDRDLFNPDKIKSACQGLLGERDQIFHPFSSKIVEGKPLWQHAKEGQVKSAYHTVTLYSIDVMSVSQVEIIEVKKRAEIVRDLVKGDFRQDKIRSSWDNLPNDNIKPFVLTKLRVYASSGTYMRVLGEELGDILGLPILAYSIKRTKILI